MFIKGLPWNNEDLFFMILKVKKHQANANDGFYFSLVRFARLISIDAIDNLKDFFN